MTTVAIDRIDHHSADITVDGHTVADVPITTWHEGAGPGWRSFHAVDIDWRALLNPEKRGMNLLDPDADLLAGVDDDVMTERLQEAYADFMRDAYANY